MLNKLNWGWRIVIIYMGFVVLILTLVYKASQNKIEIVTTDYYAKELSYQQQIDKEVRTAALADSLDWSVVSNEVELQFPALFAGKEIKADILFYRASNSEMDFTVSVNADANGRISVKSEKFVKGVYEMKIDWQVDDTAYFNKATIKIS